MFSYKKTGETMHEFPIEWEPKQDIKESKLINLTRKLSEKEIYIPCPDCHSYKICQDKYALLIIGNGSIERILENHSRNKEERSICDLFDTIGYLNKLFKRDKEIEDIYTKVRNTDSIK